MRPIPQKVMRILFKSGSLIFGLCVYFYSSFIIVIWWEDSYMSIFSPFLGLCFVTVWWFHPAVQQCNHYKHTHMDKVLCPQDSLSLGMCRTDFLVNFYCITSKSNSGRSALLKLSNPVHPLETHIEKPNFASSGGVPWHSKNNPSGAWLTWLSVQFLGQLRSWSHGS